MPRIFDNIENDLLPALQDVLNEADRGDFCVGYFNLRGWRDLFPYVDRWEGGEGKCCRLMIGMQVSPSEELRQSLRVGKQHDGLDNLTASREKRRVAQEFRRQMTIGVPSNTDERTLRHLARQIHEKRLVVKVHLRHRLHAKLYLVHRKDRISPVVGYVGSSNLTFAGLSGQGELNVDVVELDAAEKLARWFEDRWEDRWCLDISQELARVIDESWAADRLIPPYHVYLKMAYHLAQDARSGLAEFRIPAVFGNTLFDFQIAAVKIAAHHLHRRGGVLIGDVVGLGKSIMATALAKIFEDDFHTETLILCPKNLVSMWEDYAHTYRLNARVQSISKVIGELPEKTRRYRVVLIDESHNLRNKEGKRWRVIRDYIEHNDSLCILLSATPYNKTYLDLSAQLGLFLKEDQDLGIRPEKLISTLGGEHEFIRRHQCPVRSITAFEQSEHTDDWRDLMRHYMVRRTRSFIIRHYAQEDEYGKFLVFAGGQKSYFPRRIPKTLLFEIDEQDPNDPYARFYSAEVVLAINLLRLPRYGLANYLEISIEETLPLKQVEIINGLSRAGSRLMGFCRTNLFKRLESAGPAFLLSIERHILRNFIVLHAIEQGADIPLGAQDAELLDPLYYDQDAALLSGKFEDDDDESADDQKAVNDVFGGLRTEAEFRARASATLKAYRGPFARRFSWLPSKCFTKSLAEDLLGDARALIAILDRCGSWDPLQDAKIDELSRLVLDAHDEDKVLVFTQFADTARYVKEQLAQRGVQHLDLATGDTANPTQLAWKFSPEANGKRHEVAASDEIRVLIATDVLSEGQNLQDCSIIVNYDLPWAIIRLVQRAGRVDRIGQKAKEILCYSFLPADGIERLLRLRARVRQRLDENAEVVGSDESFFDDDEERKVIVDLYNERSGLLDDDGDGEVDLASYAYQIWKNATDADSKLAKKIEALPNEVYATKSRNDPSTARGALVYTRTKQGNDALAWINESGNPVTQSQLAILNAAACSPEAAALPRTERHHVLTLQGVTHILKEEKSFGGALGRPSGARFKAYERLKRYRSSIGDQRDLFVTDEFVRQIDRAMEEIYRCPLYRSATDTLNRQIKAGAEDHKLAELVVGLRKDGRLCVVDNVEAEHEPDLICSIGLV